MNEKYLPIKIFEKRKDYDDRSTEGGGDNREPGFVLHGEALKTLRQAFIILTDSVKASAEALRGLSEVLRIR